MNDALDRFHFKLQLAIKSNFFPYPNLIKEISEKAILNSEWESWPKQYFQK